MLTKSSFKPLDSYPLLLKEFTAALLAGLMFAFAIVALWLIASPSLYLLLGLLIAAFLILVTAYFSMCLILYPPRCQTQHTPAEFDLSNWEDVTFPARDGVMLGGWFIPPSAHVDGATVIFLHGIRGNRGDLLREAAMLAKHGYGALLLDLRNHGRSGIALTTLGYREVEDVWGAVTYLSMHPKVNPDRIALFGYSMGAATALCASARIPQIRAVIAQSAFTSLEENLETGVITHGGLPPFPFVPLLTWMAQVKTRLHFNQVRPIDDVAAISPRAVLFIHGKQDPYVSADNSRRLYAAAYEPKALYLVENGDHKMLMPTNPEQYERRVSSFLSRYLLGKHPSPSPAMAG